MKVWCSSAILRDVPSVGNESENERKRPGGCDTNYNSGEAETQEGGYTQTSPACMRRLVAQPYLEWRIYSRRSALCRVCNQICLDLTPSSEERSIHVAAWVTRIVSPRVEASGYSITYPIDSSLRLMCNFVESSQDVSGKCQEMPFDLRVSPNIFSVPPEGSRRFDDTSHRLWSRLFGDLVEPAQHVSRLNATQLAGIFRHHLRPPRRHDLLHR